MRAFLQQTISAPHRAGETGYDHRLPILVRPFRYAGRRTLFGRAHLFGDRIELRAWTTTGRKVRRVALDDVLEVGYHPLERGSNLTLFVEDGEPLDLYVEDAHLMREMLEGWLGYQVLASAKLLSADEAAAMAG